jgi:hypothetical protein
MSLCVFVLFCIIVLLSSVLIDKYIQQMCKHDPEISFTA